jgi:uncharacterized membrane protein
MAPLRAGGRGCDRARMLDIRRALPAVAVALCLGACFAVLTASLGLSLAGVVLVPVAVVAVYRYSSGWSERTRRVLGYLCAVLVALSTSALCAFVAFGTSLCGLWGDQCTPSEEAAIRTWSILAVVALVAIPALYAAVDLTTRKR